MSVNITDIPLTGKMKDKFVTFFSSHELNRIILGEFGKWEGGGTCAVCGHGLYWSFRNELEHRDIGICCATNIFALQKCDGNYDALNFERIVKLEKKTIAKRQKEWQKQQKAIKLEIEFNDEFKFCSAVMNLVYSDKFFQENRVVSDADDVRNVDGVQFLYAGVFGNKDNPFKKIYQCDSWLSWLKEGTVNDYYTGEIRELMKEKPEDIIQEAKDKYVRLQELSEKKKEQYQVDVKFYHKVRELQRIRLAKFDIDFVNSLSDYFQRNERYSDKQKQLIDKLIHKYRNQLSSEVQK